MLIHFKRLFKHSLLYALATSFQAAANFLLVPIYTRWLKPEGFGQLEILNSLLQILIIIFSLGFGSALVKVYIRDAKEKKYKQALLSLSLVFVLPFALLISCIMLFYASEISHILLGRVELAPLIYLTSVINLFAIYNLINFGFLRAQDRSKKYTFAFVLRAVIMVLLNVCFVVFLKTGVAGILLGNLIAQIILSIFFLFDNLKKQSATGLGLHILQEQKSKFFLKKLFKFGLPIIPASAAMFVMDLSDRYFLRFMTNLSEVGIYALGYKIGFLIFILLVTPLQLAWPTFSFQIAKLKKHKEIFAKTLTYFLIIGFILALFFSFFSREAIQILATPEFFSAQKIVPLVCLSYLFLGAHYLIAAGLHIKEKTKYYPLMILIPAGINLILNYFLIRKYGMSGAALATVIAFLVMLVLTYLISNYFYPIQYEWGRIVKTSILALLVLLFNALINLYFYQKIFLLLLFVLLVWWLILERKEKARIKQYWVKVCKAN